MVDLLAGLRRGELKALSESQVAAYDRDGYVLPALRAMPLRMGYVAKSRYPCGEQFVRGTCRNQPSIVTCIA